MVQQDPHGLVQQAEEHFESQLDQVADRLKDTTLPIRVIALAGPSSSGKTTSASKLCAKLQERGVPCQRISLDDFYLGDGRYPLREDGTPDVESVESLDLAAFSQGMAELLETGSAWLPVFDFLTRQPAPQRQHCQLEPKEMVVIEGLHALNPKLTGTIPQEQLFRLFVRTDTAFYQGDTPVLLPNQVRLIRRLVRDFHHRGYGADHTFSVWPTVLEGEQLYIRPYDSLAQVAVDSTLWYEPCVLHHHLGPILQGMDPQSPHYPQMLHLWQVMEEFDDLPRQAISGHSLLQEFVAP